MKPDTPVQVRYRPCPICVGKDCLLLHDMRFSLPSGSPLPEAYTVVACSCCGFVYADTPGSAASYNRYYAEFSHYEDPAIATGGGEQAFDRQRLAETARWIAGKVGPDARVLDIGCGNGGLLLALREQGFSQLTGMDPSSACVAHLQERGLAAMHGCLGDPPSGRERFDLIILSHVLEHLLDPRSALSSLRELLNPGGHIYVETPDAARYVEFPSVPYYYFDSEHINHFDRFALANLARAGGFRVEHSGSKTLPLMGGHAYPAVFSLLSLNDTAEPLIPDSSARHAVAAYIAQSAQASRLSEVLLLALAQKRPIALWGAGSQAQRLLLDEAMAGAQIVAVVDGDRSKQGGSFAGCTIAAPAVGLRDLPGNCLVVIAAALVAEQIQAEYHALGLPFECVVN
ncbi:MAG: class I SAM-dependent methyltransferase [Nitrosomonadales bacterium]|nr:class I SAM-dependent methyltransferase [Nitrosomonadales bacterium]